MELKSSTAAASKSKFSIDSILQRNTAPLASQQSSAASWRNAVPEARFMHLQQQKAAALALQQRHQQERNNQHLIHFILNAGQPFHSILALGSSSTTTSSSRQSQSPAASVVTSPSSAAPTMQSPPQHDHTDPDRRFVSVQQASRTTSPPGLLRLDSSDSDLCSPRRRQSSVNSTGISNDSDEDNHDGITKVSNVGECSLLSSQTLSSQTLSSHVANPDMKMAPHSSREIAFKKSRTSFTKAQIHKLEVKFSEQKYLTKLDRIKLARELGLTEKHVKTWFQNRRTKWKKDCSDVDWSKHKEMAATLMYNQYLENKNQTD